MEAVRAVYNLKLKYPGTSLVVQRVRLCAPKAEGLGLIPGQGTRSHMLQLSVCVPQLRARIPQLKKVVPQQHYSQ